jgi:hypothetical protein
VSTTEEDLETSVADDAIDALTADDTGGHDGPSTAELDALDESLVESIEDYASGDGDLDGADNSAEPEGDEEAADVDEIVADTDTSDTDPSDTDPSDDTDISDELVADDEDSSDVLAAENDSDESAEAAELFVEDEYDDDYVDDDHTFEVPKIVAATTTLDAADDETDETDADADVDDADDSAELAEAKDGDADAPGVSPNIIEELRRADIDGPVVDAAPQDDTTSGRRRPKKAVDYDPAPVPVPLKVPRILGRKPRVRKVTRVVRHVDPWSVFKIALLANFVLYVIVLVAGVLLWNVAYATGTVENVERFFESFGWQSFEFNGGELYHAAWIAGLFAVIGFTGLWVLFATLFNLITDVVGGARFTVLEEEVVESRTSPMRRFVVRRPEPEIPAVLSDASGPLIREAIIDDTGDIKR